MMAIRPARAEDHDAVVEIWLRSVRATHTFLSEPDIAALLELVRGGALSGLELWVLSEDGAAVGFMGMDGNKVEALFLAPDSRRRGGGRMLIGHAAARHPTLLVDVNEQNHEAVRFYEAMGFVTESRSALDGQGRPFPLLHMRRASDAQP